jgi:hypothetical protein
MLRHHRQDTGNPAQGFASLLGSARLVYPRRKSQGQSVCAPMPCMYNTIFCVEAVVHLFCCSVQGHSWPPDPAAFRKAAGTAPPGQLRHFSCDVSATACCQ